MEWEIAYRLDPWGPERSDLHAGIVASAAVAPHCGKSKAPRPADFMPDFLGKKKSRQMSDEEIKAKWLEIAKAWNA